MSNTRVIRVTGKGLIRVHPDMTRITMTLEGIYPAYDDALRHSSEDTERLKQEAGGVYSRWFHFDVERKYCIVCLSLLQNPKSKGLGFFCIPRKNPVAPEYSRRAVTVL